MLSCAERYCAYCACKTFCKASRSFAAVLHQLHVVRKQNGHAAQVYQRADVVNFRCHLAGNGVSGLT